MLTVNEIFHSIQGESTHAGRPCVFVRLTACDLRCRWCDTPYAFHEGRRMSVDEVMADVEARGCDVVEVTGGEPLLQADVYPLMQRLLDSGKTVLIETGGHRSIAGVPAGVVQTGADLLKDPQLRHRNYFASFADSLIGPFEIPRAGILFRGAPEEPLRLPNRFGADNDSILGDILGYDRAAIEGWRQDEVLT